MEFRIRKLEELNEQTLAHLGVIHRFMATHMSDDGLQALDVEFRSRRVSERSEAYSEVDSHSHFPSIALRRKKLLRSLTDAAFIQIPPIDDEVSKQSEVDISRENLSRNDSSVSGEHQVVQDDSKGVTSQEESDENKVSGDDKLKSIHEEKASSEVPVICESRQNSGEKTSRQNSRTRSESEDMVYLAPPGTQRVTWAEPRHSVIQSPNPRSLLLAMRTEYTSITDELESYCGLLSPPRSPPISPPPGRGRSISGMSNPEIAWQIENEHLRDAEDCDYQQMKDLIQR